MRRYFDNIMELVHFLREEGLSSLADGLRAMNVYWPLKEQFSYSTTIEPDGRERIIITAFYYEQDHRIKKTPLMIDFIDSKDALAWKVKGKVICAKCFLKSVKKSSSPILLITETDRMVIDGSLQCDLCGKAYDTPAARSAADQLLQYLEDET